MNNLKSFDEFKLNEEQYYDGGESLIGVYVLLSFIIAIFIVVIGAGENTPMRAIRKYLFKMKSAKYYTQEINELVVELSEEQRKKLKTFIKKSVFMKWSRTNFFGEIDDAYFMNKRRIFDDELQELLKIFNQEQRVKLMTIIGKLKDELERQWFRGWGYQEGKERNPDFKPLKNIT